jgi:hypothetical protein
VSERDVLTEQPKADPNRRDPNAADPNRADRDPNRVDDPNRNDDPNRAEGDGSDPNSKPKRRRSRRRSRKKRPGSASGSAAAPVQAAEEPPASEGAHVLAQSLQESVLRHTSAAVLSRGTGYAKRNRVSELRVSAGRVRGRVRGSGDQRYRVELTVPQRPAPEKVTKVRWSCDCPYAAEHRRGTCKHVVALVLVAGKRIEKTEAMHLRWLGQPAANAAEAAPAEIDALQERLLAAFTAQPASVHEVMVRSLGISPPPFDVKA